MNIKNILVPVDFSPPSRLAVDHAVALARKFRSKLTLLHIVESVSPFAESFRIETERVQKEQEEQALRMLSSLLGSEDQDDLDLRIVIKSGGIKDEILAAVREQDADMVVMGTHGRGLVGRWLIGSITEGILRRVSIPVLTVCRLSQPPAFKRILIATDLSEDSKQAFDFALELAKAMGSEIVVLHAIDMLSLGYGGEMVGDVFEPNVEEAKAKLVTFAAEAAKVKVKVDTVVAEGSAAEVILRIAGEQVPDVILITVRKKGLVERALVGATAERVVREAQVPVLSVPSLSS